MANMYNCMQRSVLRNRSCRAIVFLVVGIALPFLVLEHLTVWYDYQYPSDSTSTLKGLLYSAGIMHVCLVAAMLYGQQKRGQGCHASCLRRVLVYLGLIAGLVYLGLVLTIILIWNK
jgi:hypothetical protein